jgi:hypothetical protein
MPAAAGDVGASPETPGDRSLENQDSINACLLGFSNNSVTMRDAVFGEPGSEFRDNLARRPWATRCAPIACVSRRRHSRRSLAKRSVDGARRTFFDRFLQAVRTSDRSSDDATT